MAQIKVYGLREAIERQRALLGEAIHQALITALNFPPEKKFQRFIALDSENFLFPADRSNAYTIIEISLFVGRSVATKKELIRALFRNIEQACGITPHDLEITLFETPQENWGIRGKPADELVLNYQVDL